MLSRHRVTIRLKHLMGVMLLLGLCINVLQATAVQLSWTASVTPPSVTGYRLHYGLASGQYSTALSTGQATSAAVSGLQPSTTYYFSAIGYNSVGDSPYSNEVSYTTPSSGGDTILPTVKITAPVNGAMVWRGSTVTIKAGATDNVGVASVSFFVNGTLKRVDSTAPYTYAWKVPTGAKKTFKLQAKATDTSANVGLSPIVTVKSR